MKVMIKIPRDLQIKVQLNVGPTPTPKLGMRPRRPGVKCVCVCVWVWGGSHNHCTGEVACDVPLIPSLKLRIDTSISYLAVLKLFRMLIFGGHFEEFGEVGAAGCSQFVPL